MQHGTARENADVGTLTRKMGRMAERGRNTHLAMVMGAGDKQALAPCAPAAAALPGLRPPAAPAAAAASFASAGAQLAAALAAVATTEAAVAATVVVVVVEHLRVQLWQLLQV